MNRVRSIIFASAVVGGALAMSACNYDNPATQVSGGGAQPTQQPVTSTGTPSAAASGPVRVRIAAATVPALGTIVTDGDGYTLYRFDKDTANPPASYCTGACASTWPPVLVRVVPQLAGISPSAVGTVTRPDGTTQLTIGGWPVYRYALDTAPGEYKGEGVGGTWYAISPQGKKILPRTGALSAPTTTSAGAPYGGYGY